MAKKWAPSRAGLPKGSPSSELAASSAGYTWDSIVADVY
jgi:hypothetical protein